MHDKTLVGFPENLMKRTILSMVFALFLGGCAAITTVSNPVCTTQVGDVGYTLATKLYRGLSASDLDRQVIVGSIVNLDDINEVPAVGRLVSEHIGSRLAQLGVRVAEPRLKNPMIMTRQGEMVLSRDAKDWAARINASAIVTGTVSRMQGRYYFNARMVSVADNSVLSSFDVCLTGSVKEAGLKTSSE